MYKAINNIRDEKGFTLIELLIVVAIIGILAAIAIPGYIGMQERGRVGGAVRATAGAESDIQAWLQSSLKIGPQSLLIECDTNYDGVTGAAPDMTNAAIALAGVVPTYVAARNDHLLDGVVDELSPWIAATPLWVAGAFDPAPGACAGVGGQITLGQAPGTNSISLTACDTSVPPVVIHHKIVSAD